MDHLKALEVHLEQRNRILARLRVSIRTEWEDQVGLSSFGAMLSLTSLASYLTTTSLQIHDVLAIVHRRFLLLLIHLVWCGVVWCGVVWRDMVWCGVAWHGVVWRGVVW